MGVGRKEGIEGSRERVNRGFVSREELRSVRGRLIAGLIGQKR